MSAWLGRNWGFVATALAVAVAVHLASVIFLPRLVMGAAIDRIARAGGMNAMMHGERATSRSRTIVRPSPDLLYSSCPFDLSKTPHGALRVHAFAMPDTYWSASVFDARTDNVFVVNDRQAKGGAVDFVLVGPGSGTGTGGLKRVQVPTARGIVLFRTLIDDETRFADIDAARRHTGCEAVEN